MDPTSLAAMEYERRKKLMSRIVVSDPETLASLRQILYSIGENPEEGTDLMALSTEVVATLYHVLTGGNGGLWKPTPEDQAERWRMYRRSIPGDTRRDVNWIKLQNGPMSRRLAERLKEIKTNGWLWFGHMYVKAAEHYGKSVGNGMFALVPVHRGQFLFQFTGELLPNEPKYRNKTAMRRDYSMIAVYGTKKYTVNPLNEDDTMVSPNHFPGYINEPSPPPWSEGNLVQIDGRNAIVRDYHFESGTYDVEFSKGEMKRVWTEDVMPHPLHPKVARVYEANCMWYPFPVPLHGLYVSTGQKRGHEYVFRRTLSTSARYDWKKDEILSTFSSFSDGTGVYKLTRSIRLQPRMMVFLKDPDVFPGLERYGVVSKVSATGHITVTHVVAPHTAWRLPQLIYAGKFKTCSTCKKEGDDPGCRTCITVPFPVVHACKDIRPDEEVLCLYNSEKDKERGIGCVRALEDADFRPEWHTH